MCHGGNNESATTKGSKEIIMKLMKCGHTSNSKILVGELALDYCIICECQEEADPNTIADLNSRVAKCSDCGATTPSRLSLAFFRYQPDKRCDQYYCGCRGWD